VKSETKTEYDVLGVEANATPDEIKKGYRRQMALYHPDKLQHLGEEFVDLAIKRTTELTEAYTRLSRRVTGTVVSPPNAEPAPVDVVEPVGHPEHLAHHVTTEDAFVKSAALATFRQAATAVLGELASARVPGFDAAFTSEGRSGFFRSAVSPFLLLVRMVPVVDGPSVEAAWRTAARVPGDPNRVRCAFLMGRELASVDDLARAVARQRDQPNRSAAAITLVPVDLRSWRSLVPADAPDAIRAIIDGFRQ